MIGDTTLHWAAESGDTRLLWLLLVAGADPNRINKAGQTPLFVATEIQLLLAAGADPNWSDNCGNTPLHLAVDRDDVRVELLYQLLDAGADPNSIDTGGWSALHFAAECGHVEGLQMLLDAGADVQPRGQTECCTALYFAVSCGHYGAVDLLLQHGADVHVRGSDGVTALATARAADDHAIVALLVAAGADAAAPGES